MSLTSFLGMGIPRHVITVESGVVEPGSTASETNNDSPSEFECREDQHLLVAMKSIGKKCIPSGCHGGGCGVCKIRILAGDTERLVMSRKHISKTEEEQGVVLACRIFPRSPIRLEVIGKTVGSKTTVSQTTAVQ